MALTVDGIEFRPAAEADLPDLVPLKIQLSAAHGHEEEPAAAEGKLRLLLDAGYAATLFTRKGATFGYALWIDLGDHVFLRHFVIDARSRRRGLGRACLEHLVREVFPPRDEVRLDVAVDRARAFWSALGFTEKSICMRRRSAGENA